MHDLLTTLGPTDRVLLVGDRRQHYGVDAGRPFQQLQEAGMQTAQLDTILRQRDPALKQVVEDLAHGRIDRAMRALDRQDRVHVLPDRHERLAAVAQAYLAQPDRTLVVSPDHDARRALNDQIHARRAARGDLTAPFASVHVLTPRHDLTAADRLWAARYHVGDRLRYRAGSAAFDLPRDSYARVLKVHADRNRLTVQRMDGSRVTYDPRRLQGVTVYRETRIVLATGDRVQWTESDRARRVANKALGTVEAIDRSGALQIRMDEGPRVVRIDPRQFPHLDYGYAVTSHSSQGQTTDRVVLHVETDGSSPELVNRRLAYVALSRGRCDAQIFTDDASRLTAALSRDVTRETALEHVAGQAIDLGLGLGL